MTEKEKAIVCAICGCDRFFLMCRFGLGCDVVCSGCGVRTTATIRAEDKSNLVEAP